MRVSCGLRYHLQDWYHATQRDFTTLSINDSYQPIGAVFKATLPRVLLQAGLVPPNEYRKGGPAAAAKAGASLTTLSGNENPYPASVTERMMASLGGLRPRPGMVEAFTKTYRDDGLVPSSVSQVELWGATNGSLALGEKLFKEALGQQVQLYTGEEVSAKQRTEKGRGSGLGLFSCDEISVAKPDPRVYKTLKSRVAGGGDAVSLWFVASHTWDLFSAQKAGFRTAWVGYEEFYTCHDIYQRPDIIAADIDDVARKILAWEGGAGAAVKK